MNLFQSLFKSKSDTLFRRPESVFESLNGVFKNPEAAKEFAKTGFVVFDFLNEEELKPLQSNLNLFLDSMDKIPDSLFYTSGRDREASRNKGKSLSWSHVEPYLHRILNTELLDIEGCAWLLKPPSKDSALGAHQDSSLIDETQYASFYGWIPLQDVSKENGTIFLLPGSHKWGVDFRSLDVPWEFQDYKQLIAEYCIPLNLKAGQMVIFEGAMIHGSYPNMSDKIRAAVNIFAKPKTAGYIHYMCDEKTPKGKIESYKITMDFFYNHDFRKRPDTNLFPFYKYFDEVSFRLTTEKVKQLCEQSLRYAGY